MGSNANVTVRRAVWQFVLDHGGTFADAAMDGNVSTRSLLKIWHGQMSPGKKLCRILGLEKSTIYTLTRSAISEEELPTMLKQGRPKGNPDGCTVDTDRYRETREELDRRIEQARRLKAKNPSKKIDADELDESLKGGEE